MSKEKYHTLYILTSTENFNLISMDIHSFCLNPNPLLSAPNN